MSVTRVKKGSRLWKYEFTTNGVKHTKSGYSTEPAAKMAETKRQQKIYKLAEKFKGGNSIKIPALDTDLFGSINKNIDLEAFTSRGHLPISVKIKDHRLVKDPKAQGRVKLTSQVGPGGVCPNITAKVEVPLRLSSSIFIFENSPSTMDSLFCDLRLAARRSIEATNFFITEEYKLMFETKLKDNKIFEVSFWITKNIHTGEVCTWNWRPITNVKGVREYKLVLVKIGNCTTKKNMSEKKLRDAASGMWEDECLTYTIKRSEVVEVCAYEAGKV